MQRFIQFVACAAAFAAAPALAATPAQWTSAVNGFWDDGTRWSTNPSFPNNGSPTATDTYNVQIDATGSPYKVTLRTSVAVDSFLLNSADATLLQDTGTLRVLHDFELRAGVFQLDGGTISGGTIVGTGGALETVKGSFNSLSVLSAVNLNADLTLNDLSIVYIRNGLTLNAGKTIRFVSDFNLTTLTFDGTQSLLGSGEIVFDKLRSGLDRSEINFESASTLTIGPDITVRTGNGDGVIGSSFVPSSKVINLGLISSRTPGMPIRFEGGSVVNRGVIEAINGGIVELVNWTNQGILRVNGGTMELGGTFTNADMGTIENSGGEVRITGTLNNAIGLNLTASTGSIRLSDYGTIVGGKVTSNTGQHLLVSQGTLRGVTLDSDVDVGTPSSTFGTLNVFNGLTLNNRMISLFSASINRADMLFQEASQTIGGTGTIRFAGGNNNKIAPAGGTLTIGAGIVIDKTAGNGQIGDVNFGLVNNGTIKTGTSGSMTIAGKNWVNRGTIEVQAGSTLQLGGTVRTADLGTFHTAPGATVRVFATIDNTGQTLDLQSSIGPFELPTGTIIGGRLTGASPTVWQIGQNCVLDGVLIDVDLQLPTDNTTRVQHGMTLNDRTIEFVNGGDLQFIGSQTLGGVGELIVNARPDSSGYTSTFSGTGVTIDPGVTIRTGQEAHNGSLKIEFTGSSWVNKGTLSAETSGRLVDLNAGPVVNQGTLQAIGGGKLRVFATAWTNDGTIHLQDGNVTLSGTTFTNGANGHIEGRGTLDATAVALTNSGVVYADGLSVLGDFRQSGAGELLVDFYGAAGSESFGAALAPDFARLAVSGRAYLAGDLNVTLFGALPLPTDRITVLTAITALEGTFDNAQSTLVLPEGTFAVTYGSKSVVLSGFQPVAEPSTILLFAFGISGLLWIRLRRGT